MLGYFYNMDEILLYGRIYSDTAVNFINGMNQIKGSSMNLRINTEGGDPMYTYGMIAKYREFAGEKKIKIDGQAYSMGAFFLLFADNIEMLDVAKAMFHRVAYPSWMEENLSEAMRGELIDINSDLEKAFRSKVDVKKFEELKGVKVKDLFSMEGRIDVFLNAKECKEIGLIDTIVKITPSKQAEIGRMAASYSGVEVPELPKQGEQKKDNTNVNNKKMDIAELKEKHPSLYAQIVAEGSAIGIEQERDRVGAWAVFSEVDPEAVKAGIASGKNISQKEMVELTVKMASKGKLEDLSDESGKTEGKDAAVEKPVGENPKTKEAVFQDVIFEKLNIKKS